MKPDNVIDIVGENGEKEFQFRIFKDDGVGLLTTKSDKSYLILDSIDYWYDLIQTNSPKKLKCNCKNDWFNVEFQYFKRTDYDDYKQIDVICTCTNCKKIKKCVSVDIDYSPTDSLFSKPISYCEKPNIKYKYSELTSYWSGDNLSDFLSFMINELHLNTYCWFFKHPENLRYIEKVSFDKAMQVISINHRYLDFYFSPNEIELQEMIELSDDKGVYLKNDIWRKNEIIQLSAPTSILGYGLLYYIHFCNEYLDKAIVISKSKEFEHVTNSLLEWLKSNFVTKRGKNCYDGAEAYIRVAKALNKK
jgi:hypothetical protein